MAKDWDDTLKKLVQANPQDFVTFIQPGLRIEAQLQAELGRERVYADGLFQCTYRENQPMLVHLEFQSSKHNEMGERLLEYNVLASRDHERQPVLSCVLYLRPLRAALPTSPLIGRLPTGEVNIVFHYKILRLWEMSAISLLESGLTGVLPLVPLTEGGTKHTTIESLIERLKGEEVTPLLILNSYVLASLVIGNNAEEQLWLKRRYMMFSDILQDSPAYQEIVASGIIQGEARGREEGRVKGREEGEAEGRRKALAETLIAIVGRRFPSLQGLAIQTVETNRQAELLSQMLMQVSLAQNESEVRHLLQQHIQKPS